MPSASFGVRESDQAKHLAHDLLALRGPDVAVQVQGLADLIADRMDRRQRGHGFLKDDGDPPAPYHAHFHAVLRQARDIDHLARALGIPEQDLAAGDVRGLGQNAHDGLRDDGLPGPGLTDQREGAALVDVEADAPDRLQASFREVECDLQVADPENLQQV